MTKIQIPSGPIYDGQNLTRAITDDDGDFAGAEDRRNALLAVLEGLELGTQDQDTLRWLAGWETETVAIICSWIERARAQGAARKPGRLNPEVGPAARYGLPPE